MANVGDVPPRLPTAPEEYNQAFMIDLIRL